MRRFFPLCLLTASVAFSSASFAQQTIFNVPSADITPRKGIYLEHESQFRAWGNGRYWYGTDYLAAGVGFHTEIDMTLYNTTSPASGNRTIGVGFKTGIPVRKADPNALQITVGYQQLFSLDHQGIGYWAYSHLSGKVRKTNTRLTLGTSAGTKQLFGISTTHVITGLEQPLSQSVSLLVDWYSGRHGLGFATAGASIALPKTPLTLYVGYQVPNHGAIAGKQGLTLEIGGSF